MMQKTHGFTKLKTIWIFENTIKKSVTTIDIINDKMINKTNYQKELKKLPVTLNQETPPL